MREFRTTVVPPRLIKSTSCLTPRQLWLDLIDKSRQRILRALSCIVTQQLAAPPAIQEATNERQ